MNIINYEDFKNTDLYESFISENPDTGFLKVQVFTAYGAVPISDTSIIISKDIEDYRVIFYQGVTDDSGIIENISLPAPLTVKVANPDIIPGYTIYDMTAIHEGFETIKKFSIGMFGDVKVIQYVKMTPTIIGEEND